MRKLILVFVAATLLAGCSTWFGDGARPRQGVSSSLVDFLYPKGERPPAADNTVPHLALPVRVGLAFVPSRDLVTPGLSEARKNELLGKVRAAFAGRPFIRDIAIVPDTYLRSRNGFETVDQVARLYGFDVIALVSYDQVTYSEETKASLLYWTIVGAYFIKGNKNDVQTFVDAAIFDVRTHKLLFRAPGSDRIEATSTLINNPEETRKAREKSFDNALSDMTKNLDTELDAFRERIKTDRSVTVSQSEGQRGGGGAAEPGALVVLLALSALVIAGRRRGISASRAGEPVRKAEIPRFARE
jgi:rhombotail lipoprotein